LVGAQWLVRCPVFRFKPQYKARHWFFPRVHTSGWGLPTTDQIATS
jgi:hypothetical protein